MRSLQDLLARWSLKGTLAQVVLTDRGYPYILALGFALIVYQLIWQFAFRDLSFLYFEYLANYDFGFIRRGLIPEIFSVLKPQLTQLDVRIFGVATIAVALGAYVAMFAAKLGLSARELPLLACTIASPCLFKNFAFDLGRLDVFGFLGAIIALTMPVSGFYSLGLGLMCCVLGVIHEAQFLLYVPVIATIAALRLLAHTDYFKNRMAWREALAALTVAVSMFLVIQFGNGKVPPDVFMEHIRAKANDPIVERWIIWYGSVQQNMYASNVPVRLWWQVTRLWKYALIILAHLPLLSLLRAHQRSAPRASCIALALGIAAATAGFAIMCVIAEDRGRFFANWITGLILIVHAVRMTQPDANRNLDVMRTPLALVAAWVLVSITRVGVFRP